MTSTLANSKTLDIFFKLQEYVCLIPNEIILFEWLLGRRSMKFLYKFARFAFDEKKNTKKLVKAMVVGSNRALSDLGFFPCFYVILSTKSISNVMITIFCHKNCYFCQK